MNIILKKSNIDLLMESEKRREFPKFTYDNIRMYNDTGFKSRIVDRGYNISGNRRFSPDFMKDEFGWHDVNDDNARCFLYKFNDNSVLIGEPGKSHRYTYYEKYAKDMGYPNFITYIGMNKRYFSEVDAEIKNKISKDRFVEGRIWVNNSNNVSFAFWELPSNNGELIKVINKVLYSLNLPTYTIGGDNEININIGLESNVININDMFNNYDSIKEKERTIKPEIEKERQIHLMKQQDKRNALSNFRKSKEAKLGKMLSSYDEDGNFKSEMPMAQWRALHSTSESKKMDKKIYIKENQLPLLEYYNSPDKTEFNGKFLNFEDLDAVPFICFTNLECEVGDYGETHEQLYYKLPDYEYDEDDSDENGNNLRREILMRGRIWTDYNVIAMWESSSFNPQLIIYIINNYLLDYINGYEDIYIVYEGMIFEMNDFISKKCNKENEELFKNGYYLKSDYWVYYQEQKNNSKINNDKTKNDDNNEEENKIRQIHLMKQQDKRNALSNFRKSKEAKLGKMLSSYDEDGNFKNEMPMAQWRALHSTSESKKINKKILENFDLEVAPQEISLDSFKKENKLNPKIWDDENTINSRVRLKLLDIADDFYNSLDIKWVKPIDIILTGSICNYNWSQFSDIDLHIIVDFSDISDKKDLIKEYFDSKKNEWNNEHKDLNMFGLKVELYVQDIDEKGVSNGIYSLDKNKWIKKPNEKNVEDLKKPKSNLIKIVSSSIMTKIDDFENDFYTIEDSHKLEIMLDKCDELLEDVRNLRKKSLGSGGEFSIGNIVYKVLRRLGYLDKIWDLKIKIYDKINSIE